MSWVKPTTTSVQMGGILLGALVAGWTSDRFGRKKSLYSFSLEHLIFNLVAAFSVNWEMFAVCRFFIGIGLGGIMVVTFPYMVEFVPTKWRAMLGLMPFTALNMGIYTAAAILLDNWSHLHIACAAFSSPFFIGWFFVPESIRWLTVTGRVDEAEAVVQQLARVNKRSLPEKTRSTLQRIADQEKESRESGKKHTYLHLVRDWSVAKLTIILCLDWCALSVVYYGINFGVSALQGNLFLNMFIMAIVDVPFIFPAFFLMNKIGRRWTSGLFLCACLAGAVGCLIVQITVTEENRGEYINALSMTAKFGVSLAWSNILTWGNELYPTVTRGLGFGAVNTVARVGGMIAPFVIDLDSKVLESYIAITALTTIILSSLLILPETKDKSLADSQHAAVLQRSSGKDHSDDVIGLGLHQMSGEDNRTFSGENIFTVNNYLPSLNGKSESFTTGLKETDNIS
ncbi:solute carrier family 22 member 21 [Aplysia californica]|uniref:Solute carrier family 22 member 21 n=1 Tax=Aplysia californica TaxID=6500 RepID=A0ABM1AEG4_APLCA|nr:solute carrier family 22 member 21 [Aplysia californica]